MEPMQAVILGAVQGLTEFFPVSSSGHLVIFQQMMGFKEPVLLFDISVHVGTLAAIVVYFFNEIISIFKSLLFSLRGRMKWAGRTFYGFGNPGCPYGMDDCRRFRSHGSDRVRAANGI